VYKDGLLHVLIHRAVGFHLQAAVVMPFVIIIVKAKACMVQCVSGWTRGVQVKLWNFVRTHAIPERHRGVFTTRRYTTPRLPYLTIITVITHLETDKKSVCEFPGVHW